MKTKILVSIFVISLACAASVWGKDPEKNLCLVYGTNCPPTTDSLPEKIGKLEAEIKKGRAVYTEAEIEKLNRKLAAEKAVLRAVTRPGGKR